MRRNIGLGMMLVVLLTMIGVMIYGLFSVWSAGSWHVVVGIVAGIAILVGGAYLVDASEK